MKYRNGFVSNSSSSSFCIYGVCIDSDTDSIKNALIAKGANAEEIENMGVMDYLDDWSYKYRKKAEGSSVEDAQKMADERPSIGDMESYDPYEGESLFIGTSWTKINDNETGAEFRNRVETEIKAIFGDEIKCGTHEEAWMNG